MLTGLDTTRVRLFVEGSKRSLSFHASEDLPICGMSTVSPIGVRNRL